MKLCRNEFGYHEAIDYKSDDLAEALAAVCPQGIDVYFDNTAGQRLGLCAAGHWTSCSDLRHCIDCQLGPAPASGQNLTLGDAGRTVAILGELAPIHLFH